jgi:zinc protease
MLIVSALIVVVLVVAAIALASGTGDAPKESAPRKASPEEICAKWDGNAVADPPAFTKKSPVPVDADVRTGALDNGVRFMIRRNDRPGQSAQLRLVVNAGAVLEDRDQHGAAHFLEHMLFNGTKRFPHNELTKALQALGIELGPDINAYTSWDETVYRLQVRTDQASAVDTAFDVLAEWATNATIDPKEVKAERGVVNEERRLRAEGLDGRDARRYDEILLDGSDYGGRTVLGEERDITTMTAAKLRRFYEDWYRPDLMSVVVVGDLDPARVETMIRARFTPLRGARSTPRPRPTPKVATPATPRVSAGTDPEELYGNAAILFPDRPQRATTNGAWTRYVAERLALDAFGARLSDDAQRAVAPYFDASSRSLDYTREISAPYLYIKAEPKRLEDGIGAVLREIASARRDGFSRRELARAVTAFRREVETDFAQSATTQDSEYASSYVSNLLEGAPIPKASDARALSLAALKAVTPAHVLAGFRGLTPCHDLAVLSFGPKGHARDLPDDAALRRTIATVATKAIPRRPAEPRDVTALMARPAPVAVASSQQRDLIVPARDLTFANGVRVIVAPTPIEHDVVRIGAAGPGGASLIDEVPNQRALVPLINASGVAKLDHVALEHALAGHVVDLSATMDETSEGFDGSAATGDLELLFQLLHLRMTQPRIDPGAVATYLGENRPIAEDIRRTPDIALDQAVSAARYGDDPNFSAAPTTKELAGVDAARALRIAKDRFGDASGFVFVITGDVNVDAVETLARSYLGTLPGSGKPRQWRDRQPNAPSTIVKPVVRAGQDQQAALRLVFTAPIVPDAVATVRAQVLDALVNERLRDSVREQLSAAYAPSVSIDVTDRPDALIETTISVPSDPKRLDEVERSLLATLADLSSKGPDPAALARAKSPLEREFYYYSNRELIDTWLHYASHPTEDIADHGRRLQHLQAITAADMVAFARAALPSGHFIVAKQLPAR